jgi:hypothetical protein
VLEFLLTKEPDLRVTEPCFHATALGAARYFGWPRWSPCSNRARHPPERTPAGPVYGPTSVTGRTVTSGQFPPRRQTSAPRCSREA